MIGTLVVYRAGFLLNQTLHEVPESVFEQADIQKQSTGCVNISWQVTGGKTMSFSADKVTGLAFMRDAG